MRQLIVIVLLLVCLPARAEVFELFLVDNMQNNEPNVTVYHVNGGDLLMASANAQIKRDGVTTKEAGSRYVTNELKRALSNQAMGLMRAAKYQLGYFPALVIDGRWVVYGATSIKDYSRVKPNE